MSLFDETILKFESSNTYSCDLHELMVDIQEKIARRLNDSFFWSKGNERSESVPHIQQKHV